MKQELTSKQQEIHDKIGKFIVRACPGSGKTFILSLKLANLIKSHGLNHQGIATLSFTNTACEEIKKNLENDYNLIVEYPHFIGTIDSFINKNIFFPYYDLVLKCDNPPIIIGDHAIPWKYKPTWEFDINQYFDKVSYDIDGELLEPTQRNIFNFKFKRTNNDGSENKYYQKLKNMKKKYNRKGLFTQSDINYWSLRILSENPKISEILSIKYPVFLIDEAQDTNKIQDKILELIFNNGNVKDIVLVGDPDQAIFEWNDAEPEIFKKKLETWDYVEMNENWRSSQNICDFTYSLSSLKEKSIAKNEKCKNFEFQPIIKPYNIVDIEHIIQDFICICNTNNLNICPENIAVLTRGKNLLNQIYCNNYKEIEFNWGEKFAYELVEAKFLYDNKNYKEAFKNLKTIYLSIISGRNISILNVREYEENKGFFNFKRELKDLFDLMPDTNEIKIDVWKKIFMTNLENSNLNHNIIRKIKNQFDDIEENRDLYFRDLFKIENTKNYSLKTIHEVKGKTFEAVLLFLKSGTSDDSYSTLIEGDRNFSTIEELRTVYVALTRPKKILFLAVPPKDVRLWSYALNGEKKVKSKQSKLF